MRCPKCHYLSFEPEPRCRNCGYDLLESPTDLPIKSPEPEGPFADFELQVIDDEPDVAPPAAKVPERVSRPAASKAAVADRVPVAASPAAAPVAPPPDTSPLPAFALPVEPDGPRNPSSAPGSEFSLLVEKLRDNTASDAPLVKVPAAPRTPLGVRRPTADAGRVRAKYAPDASRAKKIGLLERDLLDLDEDPADTVVTPQPARVGRAAPLPPTETFEAWRAPVGAMRRLEAALVDIMFIGAINVALVWLTLHQCDLTFAQASSLPSLPLGAFVLLLDVGYVLMFTATNGQTIGKMAAHIRVVAVSTEQVINDRVTLGQAALRALLTFPSALALGAGFLPALFGEGLAFHDRIAHTRVVRA